MEIEVVDRKENKLLEREEIHCIIKYEGPTPNRQKVKEELKKALGLNGFIVIHRIRPMFGMMQAKVYAKVYPSEAVARKIEEDYILKRETRGKGGKEETKEEAKEEAT